jgi:hypothetical protein
MGTYMYTRNANTLSRRYAYHSCIRKTFWKRFSAFVGDSFNNTQVKTLAKAHYEHFYTSLARFVPSLLFYTPNHNTNGDTSPVATPNPSRNPASRPSSRNSNRASQPAAT